MNKNLFKTGIFLSFVIIIIFCNITVVSIKIPVTQKIPKPIDPIIGAWVTPMVLNKTPSDLFIAKDSKRVDWVNVINTTCSTYVAERWFLGKWQKINETTYSITGKEIISFGNNSSHSQRKLKFSIQYCSFNNTLTGFGETNTQYRKISSEPVIPEGINAVIPFD